MLLKYKYVTLYNEYKKLGLVSLRNSLRANIVSI